MFKILIIDPNRPFRKSLIKSLNNRFPATEIREAGSGEEGLEQVTTFAPQLIFIDIYLPDISGLDLAKKVRASLSEITMIIFAPYDSQEYQAAVRDSGVEHLIPKDDWTGNDILALVESILAGIQLSHLSKAEKDPSES